MVVLRCSSTAPLAGHPSGNLRISGAVFHLIDRLQNESHQQLLRPGPGSAGQEWPLSNMVRLVASMIGVITLKRRSPSQNGTQAARPAANHDEEYIQPGSKTATVTNLRPTIEADRYPMAGPITKQARKTHSETNRVSIPTIAAVKSSSTAICPPMTARTGITPSRSRR